ncbi:Hypothetical_protein [Hexamita inflata]|uniref:Hypothetical_protein n=1 Tax=Hexamita inflata TaxID=28002 RepID=A0AA86QRN2_9EUKA|nr:Hypothetical protein HINF_LOCUS26433 [Hexamita inflata]CAI9964756.1 Hypothetical protein HINF_LOCUS52401 [Hexamita inflata]
MTDNIPYECDTSRYYQPYKIRDKCLCNTNLVETNGFCLCNKRLGFKLHQENDNCECTKQGEYLYLSSSGRSCVLCDEKNGQVKGADGTCVKVDYQIHLCTRRKQAQKKFDQMNQKVVMIVPAIRRSQLIFV